ncbi:hypothetical protein [Natrinema pallidum]|uniref:Type I restriction enzyme R protein N-terminal domain-containing protein n=1 Tax=Natrinema pallidum TaxID=69527 RepID=A0A4P9TGA3_9EURY|nr:hypothetical protein [Natrinema pallidum]QCW03898.1 hypothetical protein FGF80_11900 [Natrinema pallidum]
MPPFDLRPFVARTAALIDSSPPTSRGETRTWLVEPFLEALGWDCRADSCVTDRTVDGTRVEYVPMIDSVPALLVAVEAYDASLEESRATALRGAMTWTGIDRAIYTNGREYLLLAGASDVDYHALTLSELADAESTLDNYSRAALARRLEHHSRDHVARRLALERPCLVDSIVEQLTTAAVQGDAYADEFDAAVDRLLDQLVVAFADGRPESGESRTDVSIRFNESAVTGDGETNETCASDSRSGLPADSGGDATDPRTDATRAERGSASGSNADAARETGAGDASGTESDDPSASTPDDGSDGSTVDADTGTDDGEYVVRFFNDRGSIGAIGHSTAAGALVEAAEYLFERGLSGIDVPWSPDDADGTVLNSAPTHADGSPMAAPTQLSNGLYLATGGEPDERAARVEALAARAGLRAMLTGDWDGRTS